ncbi:MAG: tRNA pseudouridine(55) synthase TruB [Desulfohalobiaceae bacterium]
MAGKRTSAFQQQHGLLIIDKPPGPTSTACLEKIKRGLKQKKIGHAGTLDPMARGVLLVLLGQGTKLAPYLTEGKKVYQGWLRLGMETDTQDLQGQILAEHDWQHIRPEEVEQEIQSWTELQSQQIPAFSAAKHQGQPFYKLQRQGREIPAKYKSITIDQAQVLDLSLPDVRFRVTCSAGTFIRSLAHSLGKRLRCGAVLTDLQREASQPFGLEQAIGLQEILQEPERLPKQVLPISRALPHWPRITLEPEQARQVWQGSRLSLQQTPAEGSFDQGARALLQTRGQEPVALVQLQEKQGQAFWEILRGFTPLPADRVNSHAPQA